jgi:predicted RNA-binding Zn-ribbon protein involved in translation (DUF1610 family)
MSVVGKNFTCWNCKTEVTLTSEGTSFICPKCNKQNSIPDTQKNNNGCAIIIVILVILGLIGYFIGRPKGDDDKCCCEYATFGILTSEIMTNKECKELNGTASSENDCYSRSNFNYRKIHH